MAELQNANLAAERAVIAAICRYGQHAYIEASAYLKSTTFTDQTNSVIWRCVETLLHDDPNAVIDYASILAAANALKLPNFFDKATELDYLKSVMHFPVQLESVERFAVLLQKLHIVRELHAALGFGQKELATLNGTETVDQIFSAAEAPLFDLTSRLASANTQSATKISDGLSEYMEYLFKNPNESVGISTGYPRLDSVLGGGLRPNSLTIIAARPKTGKSQLSNNIGINIAKQEIPVLYLDTEMSVREQQHRAVGRLSSVPVTQIELGSVSEKDKILVRDAVHHLEQIPYYHRSIAGEPIDETLSHVRRWLLKDVGVRDDGKANPCVIIYDYLKLMSAEKLSKNGLSEYQALGFLATQIKDFAGRYGIPVLAMVQLNREGDVSQSDRLNWFATSILHYSFKSDEEKVDGSEWTHKLETRFSRYAAMLDSGDYINYLGDYKFGLIQEGPTRNEGKRREGNKSSFANDGEIED